MDALYIHKFAGVTIMAKTKTKIAETAAFVEKYKGNNSAQMVLRLAHTHCVATIMSECKADNTQRQNMKDCKAH